MSLLSWHIPDGVDVSIGFVYFVRVVDDAGNEYRYVGKAQSESRLREYRNNMVKIAEGRPRGRKQRYRAVHLALAKALEHGWRYDFDVVENATKGHLLDLEKHHRDRLKCNLNGASTWDVNQYRALQVNDLLRGRRGDTRPAGQPTDPLQAT